MKIGLFGLIGSTPTGRPVYQDWRKRLEEAYINKGWTKFIGYNIPGHHLKRGTVDNYRSLHLGKTGSFLKTADVDNRFSSTFQQLCFVVYRAASGAAHKVFARNHS